MMRAQVHAVCALTTGDALDAAAAERLGVVHVAAPGMHLDARLRRGASTMTRLLVEASVRVTPDAQRSHVRVVHGAAWGEVDTALMLIEQILVGDALSPARFKASVHNNASGLLSIADACHEGHTAITAGEGTLGACLVEALAMLANEPDRPVVVAVADEPVPPEFGAREPVAALAVGLYLTTSREASLGSLSFPRPETSSPDQESGIVTSPPSAIRHAPLAPALGFIAALSSGQAGVFEIGGGWVLDVEGPT